MITNVPYPAFPKVGVRSWSGLAGLVVVVGSIFGIFIYGREFFFPAGMAYVLYGLTKTFALGLVDRIPTGTGMDDELARPTRTRSSRAADATWWSGGGAVSTDHAAASSPRPEAGRGRRARARREARRPRPCPNGVIEPVAAP